tara:strand:- start:22314 stop:24137 length:1824 start_codon:yes stop_codon:yes gene_type:complete
MEEIYGWAAEQPTTIVTDVPMADPKAAGLSKEQGRLLVSYTGQDTARSAWARMIVPQPAECQKHPELLDIKDRTERLTREVNFQMMQNDLIHTNVYFGKNTDFMGKIHFVVPRKYAKLALDLNLNFIRITHETEALYEKSSELSIPNLWLVCYPDWVNPVWEAWRHRVQPGNAKTLSRDPEPKRIMMIFDIANYTAYLLGARYFGEVKKACLTMIWDAAINSQLGMPIHGSSKTLFTKTYNPDHPEATPKEDQTTFITIGLSGSGKSTIGNNPHHEHLDTDLGEGVRIGNDDALVILYDPSDTQHGTVGLEDGCYNKSNDYTPGSQYLKTVQSAENVMVSYDENDRLLAIHQDVLNGNGRVQTARHLLEGADDNLNTPWPDYISLLMKDETLPPLMRIDDEQLMVSMYMCLASRSTSAENIPIEEMNKLKMVPGANPFNTWGLQQEAESLAKLFERVGCRGLILNTGGFFIDVENNAKGNTHKVPKEFSLSVYPMLARNKIKWIPWPHFPGVQIPESGTFNHIISDFDQKFNPLNVEDSQVYYELLRARLLERQNFLLGLGVDRRFVLPIRKAIVQVDNHELELGVNVDRVDNLDTLIGTGRENASL